MKRFVLLSLIIFVGCAKVTLNTVCPPGTTNVGFALSGSTIGNTAISMLGGVATKAGVMTREGASPSEPTTTNGTMTYTYLPIFGADAGSLSCTQPPAAPGVLVPGPPAQIVR